MPFLLRQFPEVCLLEVWFNIYTPGYSTIFKQSTPGFCMTRYRYAYNDTGTLVDVFDLPVDPLQASQAYSCIGCGLPLIAKIRGTKRSKHFAHKVVSPGCTEETYLHKLAKQTFLQEYQECLKTGQPYSIELMHLKHCTEFVGFLGTPVCVRTLTQTYDLTRYYDRIYLEHRDGEFIPDLLLQSSTDPTRKLYIEIAVTHLSSEKKLHGEERIIEIDIACEDDISKLRARHLNKVNARFYNFSEKPLTTGPCLCASQRYHCLIIYTSGKCLLETAKLSELVRSVERKSANILDYELEPASKEERHWSRGGIYVNLVDRAARKGIAVRSCFICPYASSRLNRSYNSAPIYCTLFRQRCSSTEAVTCRGFKNEYFPGDRQGFKW
jgi:hypothetical protein